MSPVPEYYQTFEAMLVASCAPTLAGFKSGSIFSVRPGHQEFVDEKVALWDARLSLMGIRMQILCQGGGNRQTIVYVYRPTMVQADLSQPQAQSILEEYGCKNAVLEEVIAHISARLSQAETEFSHEIGLLIGYPAQDVEGFIKHKGCNCTCSGLWKAYGPASEREKYFSKCRKCQRIYTMLYSSGTPVEKLAVSTIRPRASL